MTQTTREFDEQGDLDALDELLVALYVRYATPVDALAYSETFDRLYEELQKAGDRRSKGDVFRRMLMLRKSGRLPRLDLRISGSQSVSA